MFPMQEHWMGQQGSGTKPYTLHITYRIVASFVLGILRAIALIGTPVS